MCSIFDEVATGFRMSGNGAQAAFGIGPGPMILAKIITRGLPEGAVPAAGTSSTCWISGHPGLELREDRPSHRQRGCHGPLWYTSAN